MNEETIQERTPPMVPLDAPQEIISNQRVNEIIYNYYADRRRRLEQLFSDTRRSIETECGYPLSVGEITCQKYKELWDREPIAARVVSIYPKGCWQNPPNLYETDDNEVTTPFEQAWEDMGRTLNGPGFFASDQCHPVWHYLHRADRLSGIGQYGVLLLGIDDGKELDQPAEFVVKENENIGKPVPPIPQKAAPGIPPKATKEVEDDDEEVSVKTSPKALESSLTTPVSTPEPTRKLLFLRAFDQTKAEIVSYDTDSSSPRFGLPTLYSITIAKEDIKNPTGGARATGLTTGTKQVHWTRIVHLADNRESSEVLGVPRMQQLYNRLYDLHKLYGGSAEMYWKAAFMGIAFKTDPRMGHVRLDIEAMKQQMENWENSLQRWLSITGGDIDPLAPQVSDPTAQIDVQIEAICVLLDCPKRIFMGSERGELSSNQDSRYWYGNIKQRQTEYVIPYVVVPFVDRLIQLGILPVPKEYYVEWQDVATQTDLEKSDVAVKRTQAMAQYVAGNVEALIDPQDFFVAVLGFSESQAKRFLENRMNNMLLKDKGYGYDEEGEPVEPPTDPTTGIPLNPGQQPNPTMDEKKEEMSFALKMKAGANGDKKTAKGKTGSGV